MKENATMTDYNETSRVRKPQAMVPCFGTPVPYTLDEIEQRIDAICGCGGKYECDCVSVFGQASMELWTEHNAKKIKS